MNPLLIRRANLLSTTLLILASFLSLALNGILIVHAQDEVRQLDAIEKLSRVLVIGSDEEKRHAIEQLLEITTEKASELLLKTLKNNLAKRRGYYIEYGSFTSGGGVFWTSSPSQNGLLANALGNRKYKKALPTLRKMLEINEKWLGLSKEAVAANIHLITLQPVKYTVEGELKIYPEPKRETNVNSFTNSLSMPSSGEAAWEENSLNKRIRELVRVLGGAGGPVGFRDPFYRTLKEDVGLATLISLVKSDDYSVRPYAVEALGILGESANEIIPLLTSAIRDKDPRVRFRSVRALGYLLISNTKPEEARTIISVLKAALSDAEAEVRLAAMQAFGTYATGHNGSINERMKEVVPLLISALDDKAGYVRSGAIFALGRIGPLTEQVVPALILLLKSSDSSDREMASEALAYIPHTSLGFVQSNERARIEKEIGRALLTVVDDSAKSVRYEIAGGLGEIGPVVRGVIPSLIKLTRDPSRGVRTAAAQSLAKFEIELPRIVQALARMLKAPDEDAEVIEYALSSLGKIGREARSAAPEVRRLLKSENPKIREYAGYTIEKIESLAAYK